MGQLGTERGSSVARWTTTMDNSRAEAAYDQVTSRTGWITYGLTGPRRLISIDRTAQFH